MSYSVSVAGKTRKAVMAAIVKKLAEVVLCQPEHAVDVRQAAATVEAQLGVMDDIPEGYEFCVTVNGSISWTGSDGCIVGASVSVNIHTAPASL